MAQSTDISLAALDSMVSDYLSNQAADKHSQSLQRVRELIAEGAVEPALDIISAELPEVHQDQRLIFRLYKQQFVELLRSQQAPIQGQVLADAIACARSRLSVCALDAYPEAYTEFKRVMQLLVYAGNASVKAAQRPSDYDVLMSQATRNELAEVVYQTGRLAMGIKDPQLIELLGYLLRIRQQHKHIAPPPPPQAPRSPPPPPPPRPPPPSLPSLPQVSVLATPPVPNPAAAVQSAVAAAAAALESLPPQWQTHARAVGAASNGTGSGGNGGGPQGERTSAETGTDNRNGNAVGRAGQEATARRGSVNGSTSDQLCDSLLSVCVDAAPLTPDIHLATFFEDKDIQVLMRCFGSQRRDAIAALRSCGNNVHQALELELARLKLNRPLLDELVREYSAARGLSDARDAASPCTEDAVAAAIDSVHIADSDQPSTATGPGPLTAASNGDVNERPQHATSTARADDRSQASQGTQSQGRTARNRDEPHRSSLHHSRTASGSSRASQNRTASRSPPAKQPCTRPDEPAHHTAPATITAASATATETQQLQQQQPADTAMSEDPTQPEPDPSAESAAQRLQVSQLKQLEIVAEEDGASALHDSVERLAPGFWSANPSLCFQLWAYEFASRVCAGDTKGALEVARTHLTPLSQEHTALQPQLRAVMGLLLPRPHTDGPPSTPSDALQRVGAGTGVTLQSIAGQVAAALSNTHMTGGTDTCLVALIKELLVLHKAWMRHMGFKDPFYTHIGIAALRTDPAGNTSNAPAPPGPPPPPPQPNAVWRGAAAAAAAARGQQGGVYGYGEGGEYGGNRNGDGAGEGQQGVGVGVGGVEPHGAYGPDDQGMDDSDEDMEGGGGDWSDVARLAEVLNIPQQEALSLLQEYGDVEAAIHSRFG